MPYCSRVHPQKWCNNYPGFLLLPCVHLPTDFQTFTSLPSGNKWVTCFKDLNNLSWYDNEISSLWLFEWSFLKHSNKYFCICFHSLHFEQEFPRNVLELALCCWVVYSGVAARLTWRLLRILLLQLGALSFCAQHLTVLQICSEFLNLQNSGCYGNQV